MARHIRVSYTLRDANRVLRALRNEQRAREDQGIIEPIIWKALADDMERRISAILPIEDVEAGELKAQSAFVRHVLNGPNR